MLELNKTKKNTGRFSFSVKKYLTKINEKKIEWKI